MLSVAVPSLQLVRLHHTIPLKIRFEQTFIRSIAIIVVIFTNQTTFYHSHLLKTFGVMMLMYYQVLEYSLSVEDTSIHSIRRVKTYIVPSVWSCVKNGAISPFLWILTKC